MTKKIKFIDRLKSWLVTLGIASVFGLAALGVNAANSYQKASAYEYQDNGTLIFDSSSERDMEILYNFYKNQCLEYGYYNEEDSNYILVLRETKSISIIFNDNILDNYNVSFSETVVSFDNLEFGITHFDDDYVSDMETTFYVFDDYYHYQSLRNYVLSYNVPQQSGNMLTALTDFMSLIGGGIVNLAQSIGAGVVSFASALFIDNGSLSVLGGIIGIFAGIALAVGITTKVYTWVTTLGN